MPLMVRIRDVQWQPVVVCDQCGKLIEKVQEGGFAFMAGEGADDLERIYFIHKGQCFISWMHDHGGPAELLGDNELDVFLVYLAHSLDIRWDDQKAWKAVLEKAKFMSAF